MHVLIIIPFRLESRRFRNKAVAEFLGEPLVLRALRIADTIASGVRGSLSVDSPILETEVLLTGPSDDFHMLGDILSTAAPHRFVPTGPDCRCASDRILEIYRKESADLFVSIPLDEAALDPQEIIPVIGEYLSGDRDLRHPEALTLWCPFYCRSDAESRLSAKLVTDSTGRVLYMSRNVVPARKTEEWNHRDLKKNVGLFFFPKSFLDQLDGASDRLTTLDSVEGLEQLRWLELGLPLLSRKIAHIGFGIDVPEQIPELEQRLK